MDKKETQIAENALKKIALRERKTVEQIRKDINIALLAGMLNPNPKVQEYWKRIPCAGSIPTAEEVMVFLAKKTRIKQK